MIGGLIEIDVSRQDVSLPFDFTRGNLRMAIDSFDLIYFETVETEN